MSLVVVGERGEGRANRVRARGASSRKRREGSQMGLRTYPWEAPEHEQERAWRCSEGQARARGRCPSVDTDGRWMVGACAASTVGALRLTSPSPGPSLASLPRSCPC